MSGVVKTIGKVFKGVGKIVKKVLPYAALAAAVWFTGGALGAWAMPAWTGMGAAAGAGAGAMAGATGAALPGAMTGGTTQVVGGAAAAAGATPMATAAAQAGLVDAAAGGMAGAAGGALPITAVDVANSAAKGATFNSSIGTIIKNTGKGLSSVFSFFERHPTVTSAAINALSMYMMADALKPKEYKHPGAFGGMTASGERAASQAALPATPSPTEMHHRGVQLADSAMQTNVNTGALADTTSVLQAPAIQPVKLYEQTEGQQYSYLKPVTAQDQIQMPRILSGPTIA